MRRALEYVKAFGGVGQPARARTPSLAGPTVVLPRGRAVRPPRPARLARRRRGGHRRPRRDARPPHRLARARRPRLAPPAPSRCCAGPRRQGIAVTAEVTPHHLLLTTDLLAGYDPTFKVNPPLRPQEDVDALRAALADGTIDAVATDHAPHARHDKEHAFVDAAFGMLGLETALPVVASVMVEPGLMTWADVARVMSTTPAAIAGLEGQGRPLEVGRPANLVLVDPAAAVTVDRDASVSLSRNNPWHGRTLGASRRRDVPARRAHGARRRAGLTVGSSAWA